MIVEVRKVLDNDCYSRLQININGVDYLHLESFEKIKLVERFARSIGLDCRYGFYGETLMIDDDFTDDYFVKCACDNISNQVSLEVRRYEKKKTSKKYKKRQEALCRYFGHSKKVASNARR